MSQNGTTPTADENRAPTTIPTSIFVPMVPMFFPYGNTNAAGQTYFAPAVYPNVPTYPSTANHRHANFGVGYNTFYAPFYHTANSILPRTTHITNSPAVIPPHPLMIPPSLLPISQPPHSSNGYSINGNDTERNKNLNIRECQSPVLNQSKRQREPLKIVDPTNTNMDLESRESSSSASSLISHPESEQNPLPALSSSLIQEIDADNSQDDFLTFIEQKTKTPTTMPELNPFANEFSFGNNETLTKDSTITTNGIDHSRDNDNQPSYRLLFDNLIEKSLESIEAIQKSKKKPVVNDISTQCAQIVDSINRSTQTVDAVNNNNALLEDYSLRTIKLMDKLLENFRNIYHNDIHNQCKTMAHTCDELRHLVLFIHHVVSSKHEQQRSSADVDNPFSNMVQGLTDDMKNMNRYQTPSQQLTQSAGRGTRRLMTSTSNLALPSFSCRQIDPMVTPTSKLCLICRRPVDDSDDDMHKLCRSLSSHPKVFSDA